ncbi:putative secreted lipase [Psilocybe cubensis]|uniref:Secreted lipase n=1 Tax=Psilocybe cubensis TaxID=181762 RepID=A0ACB8H2D5_PSICU|nr:putative secreted lipase [Psilocybe cubensis]KAH9481797.1 putative secreted lipase [Psilocybe cubensis]
MKFQSQFSISIIAGFLFLRTAALSVGKTATLSSVVDLGYAQYQGRLVQDPVSNATHTQFLGVRYAAPPTGTGRFAPPAPPSFTAGVQQASAAAPTCLAGSQGHAPSTPFRLAVGQMQTALLRPVEERQKRAEDISLAAPSEDCLFLNVWVPGNLGEKENLPVVFFIHGGGYVEGSASALDGNDILRESGEAAIAVLIQYRLGLFGFLPGQKVKDGGALNAGLLDQQFALQWVQQHISKFGGDPQKVTIWGQSAGAGSVLQQVIANGGKTDPPLFRAAMTSSTFLPSQYKYNDRIPETLYREVVTQTNCSSAADTLDCLRNVDVSILETANTVINNNGFFGTFVFVPVVDGTFITDRPTQLLKQGKVNGKILFSNTNTFEGQTFVNQSTADTVQVVDYVSQLFPELGSKEVHAAAAQYAGLGTNIAQVVSIMGECMFFFSLYPFFIYILCVSEFAIPPGTHASDVVYYFGNGATPPFSNPDFDREFSESFFNFALALDVNVKWDKDNKAPFWPLWKAGNEMLFNETEAGGADIRVIKTSDALLRRCE